MAVTRQTIRLLRRLRVTVGAEADDTTRALVRAWTRAWREVTPVWREGLLSAVARAVERGSWPPPWELARIERLARASTLTEQTLAVLARRTGVQVVDAAGRVVTATAALEPRLITSQLPAGQAAAGLARFNARILPSALEAIVARTTGQITSTAWPLGADAYRAVNRALVLGMAVGDNPRTTARDMLRRVEGAFNGGLTRAMVIARTETLDAYRTASRYVHAVNDDVLEGWQWWCALDGRTCSACWSMHGRTFPTEQPGPWDHHQGRCTRVPKLKPWSQLGLPGAEPPADARADGEGVFRGLPVADQLAILGPGRHHLWASGQVRWDELAVQRTNPGWRPSYGPAPLRDLQTLADRRAAAAT